MADRNGVPAELLARSPGVLVGTVDAICDTLVERRETFGFSIVQLDAGFPLPRLQELQPVLDRLARPRAGNGV